MKTKLFSLCLLAALFIPFTAHSQYYDYWYDEDETIDNTNDSLRNISMNYYKDLNHWTIFIEPSVTMTEDTAFDQAGLKHTYFVRRFYFFALPEKTDFQYQPTVLGPYLYAYGQKMPAEGKDAQHFQMIRKAVFPFASNFSGNTSSNAIFQQYVEKNFDKDYHYIIDSLMTSCINDLDKYDFTDTAQKKSDPYIESSTKNEIVSILSCLVNEYAKAIPQPTIIEAPAREPIASPKSIEHLKKVAEKTQGNIYILPQNTILNQIAQELDENFKYNYGDNGYSSSIAEMTIRKKKTTEYEEYEEYGIVTNVYLESDDYFSPVSVSGQSYFMLNDHALLLYPETFWRDDDDYDYTYLTESREMYYSHAHQGSDTVLIISPNQIEKMTLNDCYTSCLKDTNCTFDPEFPPFLNVYINADQYDEDEYYECKDCYKKEAILEHLKEGSVMYDYFAKDFYLNNLAYKDSKSIGYYPSTYLDSEDEDDGSINIISFTKKQSQDIKKLLKKKNKLNIQAYELKVQAMAIVMDAQIPDGQLHIRKTSWGDWLLEGQNTQEEETSYDDDLVIVSVDAVDEAVEKRKEQKTSEAKWEKKISQMEKKFYKIIDEIDEVEKEIEKITGHSITLEDIY